ncbi:DUF4232 domain-containing protein [Kitasatospora sp. NPDC048538]|uniref:DUF4232 domain-containing protein n=1 Tax=unclassified Kitasatospora TaxID=2633591 RepID=UPI0033CA0235
MSVRHRRPLLATAVLVAGAGLVLTACGPDNADPAAGPTAPAKSAAATAPATPAPPATGAPATGAPATGAPATASRPATHTPPATGAAPAADHPCDIQNLTIRVTARQGAPTQRVIEVHNTGANACTLSSSPGVDLGNSAARDQSNNLRPVLASGTARFPVPAGQNAYAVIDLNPGGATTGTAPGINEVNVLVDQDGTNMPLANTHNFPLDGGTRVLNPTMGLYRPTVPEAVTSLAAAGK